jgi:hypothetical protein
MELSGRVSVATHHSLLGHLYCGHLRVHHSILGFQKTAEGTRGSHFYIKKNLEQTWWYTPIIPATREAAIGRVAV